MLTREKAFRRHACYYVTLAEKIAPLLTGAEQAEMLQRLEGEHANLRVALQWAIGAEPETALRLAGALWRFWQIRGYLREGREWLECALSCAGEKGGAEARFNALTGIGNLAWHQGDFAAMRGYTEQSLALATEPQDLSTALNYLGQAALEQGDDVTAQDYFERSLALDRETGDEAGEARALLNLGVLMSGKGDWEASRAYCQASVDLYRKIGDKAAIARCLNGLGLVAEELGDYAAAQRIHEQSIAIKLEIGNRRGEAISRHNLGAALFWQGKEAAACAEWVNSLIIRRELKDKLGIAESFTAFAEAAAQRKNLHRAIILMGAAEALREAIQAPRFQSERTALEQELQTIRLVMSPDAFEAAWNAGQNMPLDASIEYAMADEIP